MDSVALTHDIDDNRGILLLSIVLYFPILKVSVLVYAFTIYILSIFLKVGW